LAFSSRTGALSIFDRREPLMNERPKGILTLHPTVEHRSAGKRFLMLGALCLASLAATCVDAQSVTYYYTDQAGTVVAETDAGGSVVSISERRPYGARAMGTASSGLGFTGHIDDPDSGLIYMQARYYDPTVGRFMSEDAVDVMPGNTSSMNRYAYVSNNPVNRVDPTGNYERGTGWTDRQWSAFDRAQRSASSDHHKAADKLWSIAEKMVSGQKLSSSDRSAVRAFESVMGKGTGTSQNMLSAADSFSRAATALDAGTGSGYAANAVSTAGMVAMGRGPSDLAAAQVNGTQIYVNTNHPAFSSKLEWAVRHEPFHTAGLRDQRIDSHFAYKYAEGGEYFNRLREEDPARTPANPDHLTEFSK
jgi:RHS repeat-associated protein